MDSMDLEREKGITISAKNAAFKYNDYHVNIVDTPGHADFGGEVERIMNMIDGVLLVVDAARRPAGANAVRAAQGAGSRRQTDRGHQQDRPRQRRAAQGARRRCSSFSSRSTPPTSSSISRSSMPAPGTAMPRPTSNSQRHHGAALRRDHQTHPAAARATPATDFQLLAANLDYSRLSRADRLRQDLQRQGEGGRSGRLHPRRRAQDQAQDHRHLPFRGPERIEVKHAHAGDIVGLTGFDDVFIGETITDTEDREPLPFVPIDPPTIQMQFAVNDSPLAGMRRQACHRPPYLGTAGQGNAHQRRAAHRRRPTPPTSSTSAAAAKCKSPSSSSRCAAKATRSWSRVPK